MTSPRRNGRETARRPALPRGGQYAHPVTECRVVPGGEAYEGRQGLTYFHGISAESAGAAGLCLHRLTLPPGERGRAHLHEAHESAVLVLSGHAEMWWGDRLEHHLACGPGDYVYIPAGVPHLPANSSDTEPCEAIVARTDPAEQESVVLRPDLDGLVPRVRPDN